ncbi:MAG: glycosyltransferase family 39 protein, partial [Alcaligenaceae bacterium]|nr:glycosyltransferase family 39 protein [Alcaligenaceae bacterium]
AAELKTPGFLDYFLIGEHVRRFLDPGWAGDRYGTAHQAAYGTIWYYWLQATFPWGGYALVMLLLQLTCASKRRTLARQFCDQRVVYLLGWAVFTPLFFTISGNVLWTYVLPALPAFSVLVALTLKRPGSSGVRYGTGFLVYVAPLVAAVLMFWMQADPGRLKTEKWLVEYVQQHRDAGQPLYYLDDLPFSARFYSQEEATRVTRDDVSARVEGGNEFWLAVPKGYPPVPELSGVAVKVFESRHFDLLRVTPAAGKAATAAAPLAQSRSIQ